MNTEKQKHKGCFVLSLTERGDALGAEIVKLSEGWHGIGSSEVKARGGVYGLMEELFPTAQTIVFIGAAGIIVRAIAPHLRSKFSDPAVLCADEGGRFVISLLSGHIGGANEQAIRIADLIGAQPVITTATDVNGLASLDLILKCLGIETKRYRELCLEANAALVAGKCIGIMIDPRFMAREELEQRLKSQSMKGILILEDLDSAKKESETAIKIYIGFGNGPTAGEWEKVIPRVFVLGTGCRKNLDTKVYESEMLAFLKGNDLLPEAIATLASVSIKSDEACLLETAAKWIWESIFYDVEELKTVDGQFPESKTVMKALGLRAVSGPAAMLASRTTEKTALYTDTYKGSGCTFTLGRMQHD